MYNRTVSVKTEELLGANEKNLTTKATGLGKLLSVGAAIQIGKETNHATVNVNEDAKISAKNIEVTALNDIQDTNMVVTGTENNYTEKASDNDSDQVFGTAAAVLYADMDNHADVNIAGGAKLTAKNNIDVNAIAQMDYRRVQTMIGDIQECLEKIKGVWDNPKTD